MSSDRFVLDTSALLTLIEDEPGAERVAEIVGLRRPFVPAVALIEVHYITRRERGPGEADRRYALVRELSVEVLSDIDESVLLTASRFKAGYRLSFADSVIAAYAYCRRAVLVHKDPEFEALAGEIEIEALPFKQPTSRR